MRLEFPWRTGVACVGRGSAASGGGGTWGAEAPLRPTVRLGHATLAAAVLAAGALLPARLAAAQDGPTAALAGRWEGVAAVPGAPQAVILDLEPVRADAGRTAGADGATWQGSVILPGRGVKGAPLAVVQVQSGRVRASLAAAIPTFGAAGPPPALVLEAQADGRLAGEMQLGGLSAPLQLMRTGAAQVHPPPPRTALSAAYGGTWTGGYELGGTPRQVTLVLHPGPAPRAELTIVGRRTTAVPIDRIAQGPRHLTLESSAMSISIDGRLHPDRIDGHFTQGPFEAPLVLVRSAVSAAPAAAASGGRR
jgi:hypothetical protein